jgi:thiosulfate/3-mercaptopyruvate sulfurtransferase
MNSLEKITRMTAILVAILVMACILVPVLSGDDLPAYPLSSSDLLEPAALAQSLNSGTATSHIFCVAFPSLYRQKHILHAQYAGPGNSPEGLKSLKEAVEKVPKSSEIVIYCGCCPMVRCPNLQPAYRLLKELGFSSVRVLNLPTTLLADWTSKGYPVDPVQ